MRRSWRSPARRAHVLGAAGAALVLALPVAGATRPAAPEKTYPHRYTLTDDRVGRWAGVLRSAVARRAPNASSRAVARLETVTSEWTQNIVLVLAGIDVRPGETWYRVRLPILPTNSTGWVRRSTLGNVYAVRTHLYVDRSTFTARLERDGRTIYRTRIGVGRPPSPTPAGEFYVRNKLTDFGDPFFGPIAFGTSARSAVPTDWPGGAFVGIHGTDRPDLIPGAVSLGCIRMPNRAIVRLAGLMPVGTPLTIT